MAAAPVVHFEVVGKDGAKLQKFYGDLFDWSVDASNPMNYGMVSAAPGADHSIGGGIAASQDGKPMVTFYVQVPDIAAALKKAESLGGKKLTDAMDIPDGPTIAMFADPEGNTVGLIANMRSA